MIVSISEVVLSVCISIRMGYLPIHHSSFQITLDLLLYMQYAPVRNGKAESICFSFQCGACPTRYVEPQQEHARPQHRLSTLSTNTVDSLPSLVKDARAKIQGYKNQSLRYDALLKSGLNAFLTWLQEAGSTSLARDIIETNSDRQLYDGFLNLFTGLAAPSTFRSKVCVNYS